MVESPFSFLSHRPNIRISLNIHGLLVFFRVIATLIIPVHFFYITFLYVSCYLLAYSDI